MQQVDKRSAMAPYIGNEESQALPINPKANAAPTQAAAVNTAPTTVQLPIVASPEAPELFGWTAQNNNGYRIREAPMGTKRRLRVVVLGAGASGINFCKMSRGKLENVEVVCYEKNNEVGGTWLENV